MGHKEFDYVIFGSGIFGMYAALLLAKKNHHVALIDIEDSPFKRASYINQARIHKGYHYPRSISTAIRSSLNYQRFCNDFSFAINNKFSKIYGISEADSLVSPTQFEKFCDYIDIPLKSIKPEIYFNKKRVEAAFETEEFSFDSAKIRDWFIEELKQIKHVSLLWGLNLIEAEVVNSRYKLSFNDDLSITTPAVLNATYASTNSILDKFNLSFIPLKYELCEMILVQPNQFLENVGLTIMDGPFLSVMPFGLTGFHSLSSVKYTPHCPSNEPLPTFKCQDFREDCTPADLKNCNDCPVRPLSSWPYMKQQANNYFNEHVDFTFVKPLFAIKTIISSSEIDDARPTLFQIHSESPFVMTILSGKVNTIYDLEEVLE
ncbi:amino acid oxidase [Mesobacillus campisalis]|uniref:Amino acid oxidase n=1 Tax=Mesobacillus campisalis TaxID=1408103 RepID=A0A0M2SZ91_9BACI|nr:FAD/NAD(P)-binding protein [Mesobacillus campisalis]KKK39869.1 amino acid oxidase [Mesobacillus campisalis]